MILILHVAHIYNILFCNDADSFLSNYDFKRSEIPQIIYEILQNSKNAIINSTKQSRLWTPAKVTSKLKLLQNSCQQFSKNNLESTLLS